MTEVKARPMLFSGPMVRAIIDKTKTQTRRIVKPRYCGEMPSETLEDLELRGSPYGNPGDRLWVRETFCPIYPQDPTYNGGRPIAYDYAATYQHGYRLGDLIGEKKKWKPSIHMPRCASRITLEITSVQIERLHDISHDDAVAEGVGLRKDAADVVLTKPPGRSLAITMYRDLWKSINGPDSWADNPWVWVIEFKKI